jgi:ATP-dependent DNA helicase RecG
MIMSVTPEQIDVWRAAMSEDQRLEFKEAKRNYDFEKLVDYCVAIANEGGGHLLLGVHDKPPRPVVGSEAFPDLVSMADKLFHTLGFRVDAFQVDHPAGRVVAFQIPSRPRGTAFDHKGKYLMRAGESLVPMSEDKLRSIFAEGAPDWLEEPATAKLSAQEIVNLLDTQTFFELLKQPYPTHQTGVIDLLINKNLIDQNNNSFSVRRIGALLLAKNLEQFQALAFKSPRIIVYSDNSRLNVRIDYTERRGYAVGFEALIAFIMGQLPQNELVQSALRQNVKQLPERAVRELVANALVHQDFSLTGTALRIELHPNRILISNPGALAVKRERVIDQDRARNPRFTDVMRQLRICEQRGSGWDRVIDAAEFYQLPAPELNDDDTKTVVTLFGPKPFDEMDRTDRIRACYQHCALKRVDGEAMTNQSLRKRFGLSDSKIAIASQIIKATLEDKLIKLDDASGASKKLARYLPWWA